MTEEYTGVRKLADFLLARDKESGVCIDADDTALLAEEITKLLAAVDKANA